jgi:Aldo/keto reductases, related to diketogulonate reductase
MDNEQTADAVATAVDVGYRLFDTAENYGNEEGVGEGLRRSGIDREHVFITTKFNKQWHSAEGVRAAFANATARLKVDYLDLFVVHWPNPQLDHYVAAFEELTKLQAAGLVRCVGTSNFNPSHLTRLFEAGLSPDVNQIQLDPRHTRDAVRTVHREHGIQTQSWSPLGRDSGLRQEPLIVSLAQEYGKTASQIVLRWHVQQGFSAIPKASSRSHLAENLEVFDFALTEEQLQQISALDTGESDILDSDTFGH